MVKTYSSMGKPGNPFDLSKLLMEHNRYSMALTSSSSNGKWISGISGKSLSRFWFWKFGFWACPSSMSGICRPGYLLGDDEDLNIRSKYFLISSQSSKSFSLITLINKKLLFNEWVMTLQNDWKRLFSNYSTKMRKSCLLLHKTEKSFSFLLHESNWKNLLLIYSIKLKKTSFYYFNFYLVGRKAVYYIFPGRGTNTKHVQNETLQITFLDFWSLWVDSAWVDCDRWEC